MLFLDDGAVGERLGREGGGGAAPARGLEVLDVPAGVEVEGEDFIVAQLLAAPTAGQGLGWKGW